MNRTRGAVSLRLTILGMLVLLLVGGLVPWRSAQAALPAGTVTAVITGVVTSTPSGTTSVTPGGNFTVTPVPNGTQTIAPVTGGTFTPGPLADLVVSGTITGSGNLSIACAGYRAVGLNIVAGTWSAGTITIQTSTDGGTTWVNSPYYQNNGTTTQFSIGGAPLSHANFSNDYILLPPGTSNVQLVGSAITGTTGTIVLRAVANCGVVSLAPWGVVTNLIGAVQLSAGALSIGTVGLNAGTNAIGHINGGTYTHITTDTTTTCKSGAGVLKCINVNTLAATSTITVFDNTVGSGTVIAVIGGGTQGSYQFDVAFATGCTIVTAVAAPDITVTTY